MPILNWNRINRKANLNANWDDNRNWNYAVPVVRDYSNYKGLSFESPLFNRFEPAAEHAASFVEFRFQLQIGFIRYALTVITQPY